MFDSYIIDEIVDRYNRDIKRVMVSSLPNGPDIFKQAGYLTFWIRKLKPVVLAPNMRKDLNGLNEVFAFLAGLVYIKNRFPDLDFTGTGEDEKDREKVRDEFCRQFIYNLRYGSLSPSVISQLYVAIYTIEPIRK